MLTHKISSSTTEIMNDKKSRTETKSRITNSVKPLSKKLDHKPLADKLIKRLQDKCNEETGIIKSYPDKEVKRSKIFS